MCGWRPRTSIEDIPKLLGWLGADAAVAIGNREGDADLNDRGHRFLQQGSEARMRSYFSRLTG